MRLYNQPDRLPYPPAWDAPLDREEEIAVQIVDPNQEELAEFLLRNGLKGEAPWSPSGNEGPVVAARDGGRDIGVGRLYRSSLHPERWRLSLFVDPSYRRRGVGSALLDALSDRLPAADRELQAATSAADAACIAFLAHGGFVPLMSTRIGVLDPASIPGHWWSNAREARAGLADDRVRIVTLAERPDLFEPAARAHEQVYRDQHAWNPPVDLLPEQARELFLDPEELTRGGQFLAISGEEIVGIASLRTTDDSAVMDLGWVGTIGGSVERGYPVTLALFGRCMDEATRRHASIALEIDQVDPSVNRIVDGLPIEWEPDWLTFAR